MILVKFKGIQITSNSNHFLDKPSTTWRQEYKDDFVDLKYYLPYDTVFLINIFLDVFYFIVLQYKFS